MVKYVHNPDWKHKKNNIQHTQRLREKAQISIMRSGDNDKVKKCWIRKPYQ